MQIISACELCGEPTRRCISLCQSCENDLAILNNTCKTCAIELDESTDSGLPCGQCLQHPPAVDYSVCVYHYDSPVDFMIGELKFNQQLSYATILAYLLQKKVRASDEVKVLMPEVLLPVPLHDQRLVKRGFNQSLEITKVVSKYLNIPFDKSLLKRTRYTRAQTDLNAKERKKNIRGCFEIGKMTNYKHVVLIDDVVTTTSTTNELASVLKKSGVETVGVWAIARAVLKH